MNATKANICKGPEREFESRRMMKTVTCSHCIGQVGSLQIGPAIVSHARYDSQNWNYKESQEILGMVQRDISTCFTWFAGSDAIFVVY